MSENCIERDISNTALHERRGKITYKTTSGVDFVIENRYSLIKCIGEGSYGVVVSVDDAKTKEKRAIKKVTGILKDPGNGFRVYREMEIMRHCHHENILSLLGVDLDPEGVDFSDLYITMELMETDLSKVIYSKQVLTDEHVQYFMYQILRALKYLHSANIIHRDLKPSNILLNSNCDLKICDFNLAREQEPAESMTEYVVTRWYRAPEIMLNSKQYTKEVDLWSAGCIMGELLLRHVLFQGTNYINQIKLYCDLLGAPEGEDLEFVTNERGRKYLMSQNHVRQDFRHVFPTATEKAIDLLEKLLVMNPAKRITAEEALKHPYFEDFHDESDEPTCSTEFTMGIADEEVDENILRNLLLKLADLYRYD